MISVLQSCPVLSYPVLLCLFLPRPILFYSALHLSALSCTVLYCTVLYCIVLYCIVLYCTVLYCAILYCAVPCFHTDESPGRMKSDEKDLRRRRKKGRRMKTWRGSSFRHTLPLQGSLRFGLSPSNIEKITDLVTATSSAFKLSQFLRILLT
jgi:hypothetical protein